MRIADTEDTNQGMTINILKNCTFNAPVARFVNCNTQNVLWKPKSSATMNELTETAIDHNGTHLVPVSHSRSLRLHRHPRPNRPWTMKPKAARHDTKNGYRPASTQASMRVGNAEIIKTRVGRNLLSRLIQTQSPSPVNGTPDADLSAAMNRTRKAKKSQD